MYALEDEPESKGRWRRLGGGALIAAALAGGLVYGATKFEPARRLMQKVVEITVAPELPKDLPPPRTEPPPPPPKRTPPPQKTKVAAPKDQAKPAPTPGEETVGLDSESFGEGSGGPSFQVGNTQMGEPPRVAPGPKKEEPKAIAKKIDPVRVLDSKLPEYPRRARQLGIEGLIVIEVEVDEEGRVTAVRLRQSLDEELDRLTVAAAKKWLYEPARLDGHPIASTKIFRLRYALEN